MMDSAPLEADSGDMSIRALVEPVTGAVFITLWIVAEAGREPAIPAIVVLGLALGVSRLLPRVALVLALSALLLAGAGTLLPLTGPAAAVLHPIGDTEWPLYLAALAVPALVAAVGSAPSLRPSLIAAPLAALGLAALLASDVAEFAAFAVYLVLLGLALWGLGWLVAAGLRFVRTLMRDPLIRARVNDALKLGPSIDAAPKLTARERDVLLLVSDGKSNAEIAKALFLSEATVKSHLRSILAKFSLKSRTEIVAYAWRMGLVQAV